MKQILLSIYCLLTVVQITFAQGVAVPNRPNRPQPKVKLNVPLPKVNFQDIAAQAGLTAPNVSGPKRDKQYIIETIGSGVALVDYDNDGWPDVYLACDSTPNLLFHNEGDGTFTEIGLLSGTAVNEDGQEQAGMGVGAGDYGGRGKTDGCSAQRRQLPFAK